MPQGGIYPSYFGLRVPSLTSGASNFPILELQTGATDYVVLHELECMHCDTGVAGNFITFGLGIPAARGVGRNPTYFSFDSGSDKVPQLAAYTDWSTQPTVPTAYHRRFNMSILDTSNMTQRPVLFRFPRGLKIAPSSSIVLWEIAIGTNIANTVAIMITSIVADG